MKFFLAVITFFICTSIFPQPDIESFCKEFSRQYSKYVTLYLNDSNDSCNAFAMLVKLEFDKDTNLVSFKFSDSAPEFIKTQYGKNPFRNTSNLYIKVNAAAKRYNITNCTIIFPSYGVPTNKCSNFTGEIRPENYNNFDNTILYSTAYIGPTIVTYITARRKH